MKKNIVIHRFNSNQRQHYLLEKQYSFKIKPRLLYSGILKKMKNWHDNTHSHNFVEIVFVVDGKGTLITEKCTSTISKGDILIYNSGMSHAERSDSTDPLSLYFIALDKLEITDLPPNHILPEKYDIIYHSGDMYQTFYNLFERIINETHVKDMFYAEVAQDAARMIVMYIFRIINKTYADEPLLDKSMAFADAITYIDEHFKENITLDLLAEKCHVNKYYLAHSFSQYQNISIGNYILQKRLNEAKALLKTTTLAASAVAENCGFNDQSYFCRVFKKNTGMTPAQFRKSEQ